MASHVLLGRYCDISASVKCEVQHADHIRHSTAHLDVERSYVAPIRAQQAANVSRSQIREGRCTRGYVQADVDQGEDGTVCDHWLTQNAAGIIPTKVEASGDIGMD